MSADNRSFIFIVTYGRSGSTVLQGLLQAIPGYFIRGENMNTLFPLYKACTAAHTARYTHGKNPHGQDDPWFGADVIKPEVFTKRIVDTFIEEILQPPADARVVGFKEIRFHEGGSEHFEPFLNFIFEHFPGCKFIFN
ncbi:MAG: sulfotransferase, partial [Kordiimonadaceae bacterium]|nr:sulfotransferase [Kordiimonadaceae bacterium]